MCDRASVAEDKVNVCSEYKEERKWLLYNYIEIFKFIPKHFGGAAMDV